MSSSERETSLEDVEQDHHSCPNFFYHETPHERMKTAKATPNREVSEVMAMVVGLPAPLLELELDPVLEGPVDPVLVLLVWVEL
jgi:hypothetical protein